MTLAIRISLLFSGIFLLTGMLTGVWKYLQMMKSENHLAPVYVDIAHRASLLYSFACLVIAKLMEFSPYSQIVQMIIVIVPIVYFALAIFAYIKEGYLNQTDNMLRERNFTTTWFVYSLIFGEVSSIALILSGFIYTQFFIK